MNISSGILSGFIALVLLFTACSPQEDDSQTLGGSLVQIPQDIQITAVDNNNEIVITFDPLTLIDGDKVLGVQFSSPQAGINFTVKDKNATTLKKKVYRSGEYVLYAAVITRAGTGTPREIPFTVTKNLLLEIMSKSIFTEEVVVDNEKFYKGELYIEKSSQIELEGELAGDDVIVNMDFFTRQNATTTKFEGESGVYSLYWNPVRKNVIIEPAEAPTSIASPNYYVLTGMGIGYPTTVSSENIIAAYGGGEGRYTTKWDPGANIRTRVIMRSTGTDTYRATVCINEGAAFKPFSNANWGNDSFAAENCKFTGSPIFKDKGDWSPNAKMDKNAYYRLTLNAATKAVTVNKVSETGEIIPDEEEEGPGTGINPNVPFVSEVFDLSKHAITQKVQGETTKTMFFSLEKNAEYTLEESLAMTNIVYNVDFFERVSDTKVKFLGETGNYRLHYNTTRRYVLISPEEPRFPNYLVACGLGLGYPTKIASEIIGVYYPEKTWYTTDWNVDNAMNFLLCRKVADKKYQVTAFINPGQANFKPFENTSDWWTGAKPYGSLTFSGENIFEGTGKNADDLDWKAKSNTVAGQAYRITIDLNNNTVHVAKYSL